MYGFDQNTQSEGTGVNILPVGVNNNVYLTRAAYENSKQDGSGQNVLAFHFENSNGQSYRHTEFEIDSEYVKKNAPTDWTHKKDNKQLGFVKGQPVTAEDMVKMRVNEMNTRIKHILTKFIPEEKAAVTGVTGWQDFCQKVANLFPSGYDEVPLQIKVVYNFNDYLTFPKFPPFIRRMDQIEEMGNLEITQYDKVEKSATADKADDNSEFASADTETEDNPAF